MDNRMPEKKEKLLATLEKGMAMVHLDARRPGVLVPAPLKAEANLRLNLSYRFDPPDLTVGEWGVRSTLSFGGKRFTVAIPWSALYAVSSANSKEFFMWPEDMPAELVAGLSQKVDGLEVVTPAEAAALAPEEGEAPASSRAVLRQIVNEHPPEAKTDDPQKEPPKRGHLRLVK
jgi:stringent starvation protein B